VIGRFALAGVCDCVANDPLVTVELGEVALGDRALLIICALVETDAVSIVQIRMRNANGKVLL